MKLSSSQRCDTGCRYCKIKMGLATYNKLIYEFVPCEFAKVITILTELGYCEFKKKKSLSTEIKHGFIGKNFILKYDSIFDITLEKM